MSASPALPPFAAVIVAAGKGLRAGGAIPKQFANWRGKPLLRHSAEALAAAGASPIVVAIPENADALAEAASGWLSDPQRCQALQARFTELHHRLRRNTAQAATDAIQKVIEG